MTSIPVENQTLPEKLSAVPPAKLAATVKGIQAWTANAFQQLAEMVKAVKRSEEQSAAVLERLGDITTAEEYEEYLATLRVANARIKEFEGSRTGITGPVNQAVSRVNDLAKDGQAGWRRVVETIGIRTAAWRRKQEEEARREQERQRQALVRQQEQERIAREKEAAKLEQKGRPEEAQAVRDAVESQPPPVAAAVKPDIPKVSGAHVRTYWHFRIVNEVAFYDQAPPQFIVKSPNTKALEAFATATEGKQPVPGVEFYATEKDVVRG